MSSESALTQELLQYQIVSALFARTVRHEVVLKGGLALRALYGSSRRSCDPSSRPWALWLLIPGVP